MAAAADTGIVELRGGKLVLDGDVIYSTSVMPGDRAEIRNGVVRLLERQHQALPGVIQSVTVDGCATVRFPILGESCPFCVTVAAATAAAVGDYVVVDLTADGGAAIKRHYTASVNEAEATTATYRLTGRVLDNMNLWRSGGPHHYTRDDVVDETGLHTITVDPAGSVDFDDAISVDVENRTVYIHIVDIVGCGTLTDADEYRMRQYCQTLYLANEHTEHLLHDVHGVSLVAGEERRVITVRVRFSAEEAGIVESYDIYRSRIVVKERLTYEQFGERLAAAATGLDGPASFLMDLLIQRSSNAVYDIQIPSVRIHVDQEGVCDVSLEHTNDPAHRVIAMLMVLANIVVSAHLCGRGVIVPSRFQSRLSGVQWSRMPVRSGEPAVDSFVLLKRFARACYAIDKWGHFGLGLTEYVHFTSPMRRYADVIVHRLLAGWEISRNDLEEEVGWINWRSQFNRSLQRQYTAWKVAGAISGREGSVKIWVTGVSAAGVLWYMPEYSLNGFCHVSQLMPRQRWTLNAERTGLTGSSAEGESFDEMCAYDGMITGVNQRFGTVSLSIRSALADP
jgi:hypothetical protein